MQNRQPRSDATRTALMRAAETLIAGKGIENVSIREIVAAAGQKNESALQYHFGSRRGLIAALHDARQAEIQAKRDELLRKLLLHTRSPSLRQICKLMVQPPFDLARSSPHFRRYIKAFGHEITLTDQSALAVVNRKGGSSARQTGGLLRAALRHLDEDAYQYRMDGALRFIAASMVHHARGKRAFRGEPADLFFHRLIDALEGMLSAPESGETRAFVRSLDAGRIAVSPGGPGITRPGV